MKKFRDLEEISFLYSQKYWWQAIFLEIKLRDQDNLPITPLLPLSISDEMGQMCPRLSIKIGKIFQWSGIIFVLPEIWLEKKEFFLRAYYGPRWG